MFSQVFARKQKSFMEGFTSGSCHTIIITFAYCQAQNQAKPSQSLSTIFLSPPDRPTARPADRPSARPTGIVSKTQPIKLKLGIHLDLETTNKFMKSKFFVTT